MGSELRTQTDAEIADLVYIIHKGRFEYDVNVVNGKRKKPTWKRIKTLYDEDGSMDRIRSECTVDALKAAVCGIANLVERHYSANPAAEHRYPPSVRLLELLRTDSRQDKIVNQLKQPGFFGH